MKIHFSKEEVQGMSFTEVERRKLSHAYFDDRERLWEKKLLRAKEDGTKLWNGEVYTIERLMPWDCTKTLIELSTCEYKDIVFRLEKGPEFIARKYGHNHLLSWAATECIPITRDGKFVFGIRGAQSNAKTGTLGLIGGTLNKDEKRIETFADIRAFAKKEVEEETRIEANENSLVFFALNYLFGWYQFLFALPLPNSSEELNSLYRPGEFSALLAMSQSDCMNTTRPMQYAFDYCRKQLPELFALVR